MNNSYLVNTFSTSLLLLAFFLLSFVKLATVFTECSVRSMSSFRLSCFVATCGIFNYFSTSTGVSSPTCNAMGPKRRENTYVRNARSSLFLSNLCYRYKVRHFFVVTVAMQRCRACLLQVHHPLFLLLQRSGR